MTRECLWYNGETACYELLDFNPDEYNTKIGIKTMALSLLKRKYGFSEEELEKVSKTLYLLDIDNLENLEKENLDL